MLLQVQAPVTAQARPHPVPLAALQVHPPVVLLVAVLVARLLALLLLLLAEVQVPLLLDLLPLHLPLHLAEAQVPHQVMPLLALLVSHLQEVSTQVAPLVTVLR